MVIVLAIDLVVIKGAHGPYVSLLNSQVEQHSKLLFFSILCVPLHSLPTFHSLLHPKRHYHVSITYHARLLPIHCLLHLRAASYARVS